MPPDSLPLRDIRSTKFVIHDASTKKVSAVAKIAQSRPTKKVREPSIDHACGGAAQPRQLGEPRRQALEHCRATSTRRRRRSARALAPAFSAPRSASVDAACRGLRSSRHSFQHATAAGARPSPHSPAPVFPCRRRAYAAVLENLHCGGREVVGDEDFGGHVDSDNLLGLASTSDEDRPASAGRIVACVSSESS